MSTTPALVQEMLRKYEKIFYDVNQGTNPVRVYPGTHQLISEYEGILNDCQADAFFSRFGVGNATEGIHKPFERQLAYESLLLILKSIDSVQFDKIHKGTPYYFIGWTTYQCLNFSKAIFYLDAAASEDLKLIDVQSKISTRPSLDFFLLIAQPGPSGLSTHIELIDIVKKTLQEYSYRGGGTISIDDFRNKFASDLLYSGAKERSLLSAFYTFLLEYEQKENQIDLRSDLGGSIQPFLDHLFDGARILESLLEKRGGTGNTLKPKIVNTKAISVTRNVLLGQQSLADAEQEFNNLVAASNSFQDCNFAAAYIIRNTTGHSLLWPDQFASFDSYKLLYNCLINSILWTIEKLWL